jgi:phenylalanyl-tRNA synthetase beta chain
MLSRIWVFSTISQDVAIAYGYNNIVRTVPTSYTQGKQQPLNHFSDLVRAEIAMAGFTEVVTWILGSHHENFAMVNREDDGKTAVIVGNPRTSEFEVVRSSLLPGILKTMGHNKDSPRLVFRCSNDRLFPVF